MTITVSSSTRVGPWVRSPGMPGAAAGCRCTGWTRSKPCGAGRHGAGSPRPSPTPCSRSRYAVFGRFLRGISLVVAAAVAFFNSANTEA